MNFGFYISGKAARFKKMLDEEFALLEDVKVIFSDDADTSYLEPLLRERGIPYELFDYKKIDKGQNRNLEISNELLKTLSSWEVDYCFCFGRHLLKGEILKEYENRIINFHPSVLPLFPGVDAIDQALAAKVKILGNTAHFVDQGMDTGPIILQNVLSVKVFEEKGYSGVLDYQLDMVEEIYGWLKQGRISVKDREVLIEGGNYMKAGFFPAL